MTAALLEQDYLHVQGLLRQAAWTHVRTYGGDAEEAFSDANLEFLRAHEKFDPQRGVPYHTYISRIVRFGLLDRTRSKLRKLRQVQVTNEDQDLLETVHDYRSDKMAKLQAELNPASLLAMWIVLGIADRFPRYSRQQVLRASTEKLRSLGWTDLQIAKAYNEIRGCLHGN